MWQQWRSLTVRECSRSSRPRARALPPPSVRAALSAPPQRIPRNAASTTFFRCQRTFGCVTSHSCTTATAFSCRATRCAPPSCYSAARRLQRSFASHAVVQSLSGVLEILHNAMKSGPDARHKDAKVPVAAPPALKSSRCACASCMCSPLLSLFAHHGSLLHLLCSGTKRYRSNAFGRSAWAPATWMSWASTRTHPSSQMRCSRCLLDCRRLRRRLSRRRLLRRPTCKNRRRPRGQQEERGASKKRRAAFRSSSCLPGACRSHLGPANTLVKLSLNPRRGILTLATLSSWHRMGSQVLLNMFNAKPFFEDCAFIPWEQQKSVRAQ